MVKDPVVVFTPTDKTYAGPVQPVKVQAQDKNGTPVTNNLHSKYHAC